MIAALLALALLGGAVPDLLPAPHDASPSGGEAQINDPKGDAYDDGTDSGAARAFQACAFAEPEPRDACGNVSQALAPLPVPSAGTPAPPSMDLLRAWFTDTPTTLDVTFEVASLGTTYDESYDAQRRQPVYFLCWATEQGPCHQQVQAFVKRDLTGGLVLEADAGMNEGCNGWSWCNWKVEGRLEPGTPGRLVVSVPRALLAEPDAANVREPIAATGYFDARMYEHFANYGILAPGVEERRHVGTIFVLVDWAQTGTDYTLATPRLPEPLATSAWTPSAEGMHSGVQADAIDIRGVALSDNETTLTVEMHLASLQKPYPAIWHDLYLGAPDGTILWLGVNLEGEDVTSYATACGPTPEDCRQGHRDVVVEVDVREGTPAQLVYHIARTDLGRPQAGEMLTLLAADASVIEYTRVRNENADGVSIYADKTDSVDWFGYAYPWRFSASTTSVVAASSVLRDATGDARLPAGVLEPAAMFDIMYVEVAGVAPGVSRITMGLQDLSRVLVPAGYDGVLYAAAVETDRGAFMAGYHKSSAKDDGGKFFCAPDVDVFTQAPRDPTETVWQEITGIVTLARAAQGGQGGGTSGSITFNVPNSCLEATDIDTLTAARVGAGTFLIPSVSTPGAPIVEVDRVEGDEAVVLGTPRVLEAPAPWWARDSFWNIAGIAIAMGGGAFALAARQRRRSVLAREIRAVDDAHAKHHAAPAMWRKAMTDRRTHSAEQLRKGKLRPDELLVVERRIDLLAHELPPEAPPAPPALEVGVVLNDRYRVERVLGEGGQGRALLARDDKLTRQVVLKTLRTADMDPQTKRLLLAEARLAGSLDHPNVVRVHDVVENPRSAVLVMEYVPGGTLRGLLQREGRVAPAEAARILGGVLEGLSAAHARGIVHRDVKPENVLLAREGTPKLSDFGAATEARPDATIRPLMAGTLAYMSPEQVRGATVDARSDLYSAAAILHELLSGTPYLAIQGLDDFQVRAAILESEPQIQLPDAALAYSGLLVRALAKDPAQRYQSAGEMLAALRRLG